VSTQIREHESDLTNTVRAEAPDAVFHANDLERYRNRWREVQASFVDVPRQAVQQADELVGNVIRQLTEMFSEERTRLEAQLSGGDTSTEDLRQAVRRYRSFFDRLLSV
jgi:hypothetical protein